MVLKAPAFALAGLPLPLVSAWLALAALVLTGFYARPALALTALFGFVALFTDFYRNHLYLLSLVSVVLTVSPCDRAFSLRPSSGPTPPWPLFVLRCQLSIVYAASGVAKLMGEWRDGTVVRWIADIAVVPTPGMAALAVPISWAVIVTQLGLAVGLWVPFARRPLVLVVAAFQLGTLLVADTWIRFFELLTFGALMAGLALAFLAPITETKETGRAPRSDPMLSARPGM